MESLNLILDAEKQAEKIIADARSDIQTMRDDSKKTVAAGFAELQRESVRRGNEYKKEQLEQFDVKRRLFDEETKKLLEEEEKKLKSKENEAVSKVIKAVLGRS